MAVVAAWLAVLAGALGLAACGGGQRDDEPKRLRVGFAFGIDANAIGDALAIERAGRELGLKVQISDTSGNPNTIAALRRGAIEVGNLNPVATAAAIQEGAPLRAILGSKMAVDHLLVAGPGIDRIAGLAGKRVGYTRPGSSSELFTRLALARARVEQKVRLVALPESPNRARALAARELDAADLEYVDLQRLRAARPNVSVLADGHAAVPDAMQSVWVVTDKFAAENRQLVQRMVDAMLEQYETLYTPAGRAQWLKRAREDVLRDDDESLRTDLYRRLRAVAQWPQRDRVVSEDEHDRVIALFVRRGALRRPVRFQEVWDVEFWRRSSQG